MTATIVSTPSVIPVLVTTSSMVSGRETPACRCSGYCVAYGWACTCCAPQPEAPVPNCAYPPCPLGRDRNTGLLVSRTVGSSPNAVVRHVGEHHLNDRHVQAVPVLPGHSPRTLPGGAHLRRTI